MLYGIKRYLCLLPNLGERVEIVFYKCALIIRISFLGVTVVGLCLKLSNASSIEPTSIAKIMIVDDDYEEALSFRLCLEQNGFYVRVYTNPLIALSQFRPHSYDLLLIDIKMPQLNGFQLVEKLNEIDKEVKVCFITAFEVYYNTLRQQYPHLGIKCLIRKRFECRELIKQIMIEIVDGR
jgi:two-component system, OmpR family, response regulator ChvI